VAMVVCGRSAGLRRRPPPCELGRRRRRRCRSPWRSASAGRRIRAPWPTLPGAPSRSPVYTVWMESTIITAGRRSCAVARIVSRFVSPSSATSSDPPPSRSARSFTWRRGLLTAHVERAMSRRFEARGDLQENGGLADARLAADQHHRAGTTRRQHEVELREVGAKAMALGADDLTQARRGEHRAAVGKASGSIGAALTALRRRRRDDLLDERVPRGAGVALACHWSGRRRTSVQR